MINVKCVILGLNNAYMVMHSLLKKKKKLNGKCPNFCCCWTVMFRKFRLVLNFSHMF